MLTAQTAPAGLFLQLAYCVPAVPGSMSTSQAGAALEPVSQVRDARVQVVPPAAENSLTTGSDAPEAAGLILIREAVEPVLLVVTPYHTAS